MYLCDSIYGVRADDCKIRHLQLLLAGLIDDGERREHFIQWAAVHTDRVEENLVQLVDDLLVPLEHLLEERDAPLLERLRHQCVGHAREHKRHDLVSLSELETLLVDEDAQQLRNHHS